MSGPTIIGKPAILVVDDSPEWIERMDFSLGDQYMVIAATDLTKSEEIARRHWRDAQSIHA